MFTCVCVFYQLKIENPLCKRTEFPMKHLWVRLSIWYQNVSNECVYHNKSKFNSLACVCVCFLWLAGHFDIWMCVSVCVCAYNNPLTCCMCSDIVSSNKLRWIEHFDKLWALCSTCSCFLFLFFTLPPSLLLALSIPLLSTYLIGNRDLVRSQAHDVTSIGI